MTRYGFHPAGGPGNFCRLLQIAALPNLASLLNLVAVASVLCPDFEPEARLYTHQRAAETGARLAFSGN